MVFIGLLPIYLKNIFAIKLSRLTARLYRLMKVLRVIEGCHNEGSENSPYRYTFAIQIGDKLLDPPAIPIHLICKNKTRTFITVMKNCAFRPNVLSLQFQSQFKLLYLTKHSWNVSVLFAYFLSGSTSLLSGRWKERKSRWERSMRVEMEMDCCVMLSLLTSQLMKVLSPFVNC